jgi:hypothetical protein
MIRDYPLLHFANFVNELMLSVPSRRHADPLVAVSPRKIWLTQPGDVVVIPRPMSQPLRDYACDLLGFEPSEVEIVSAPAEGLVTLSEAVRCGELTDHLAELAAARPGIRLNPFAQDRPAVATAHEIGLPVDGYAGGGIADGTLTEIYRVNTKPGFRQLASELGIRVADGYACDGPQDLVAAIRKVAGEDGGAVVKPARGSNGFGVWFVSRDDLSGLESGVDAYLASVADQPSGWVVERWLDFERVVTVEMAVDDHGPHILHVGEMRTPKGSFSGQITPLVASTEAVDELKDGGLRLGRHLDRAGYRGPFDIDGGIADGRLYATESNVRRTGCTYLDLLVQRLLGTAEAARAVWLADSRPGGVELDFAAGLDRVRDSGLDFRRGGTEGVVLTSDTLAFDGKWRYLIIAGTHDRAQEIEYALTDVLQLA